MTGVISKGQILAYRPKSARICAGAASRDITPPVGIYNRNWGAAKTDVATGIHRPLVVSVLAFKPADTSSGDDQPAVLVSMDAGWYRCAQSEWAIRGRVLEALGLPASHLMIALTHTHAACSLSASESNKPGGQLIEPYIEHVIQAIIDASNDAINACEPAVVTMATGSCTLATNRDLADPDEMRDRFLTGYNPQGGADRTLVVGRVSSFEKPEQVVASFVNYACHPTTLAWQNSLISPDYIGAMREVVQQSTGDAPCLFLQGASGELAPREQYTGDTAVADAHGRELGQCVLAAFESMLPAGVGLTFERVVESGAPLAVWSRESFEPAGDFSISSFEVEQPLRDELPTLEAIKNQLAETSDRALAERLHRKLQVRLLVGDGKTTKRPAWVWRLGDVVLVGHPDEAYSALQTQLRERFTDRAVVVMNIVNGHCGYLPPRALYDHDIYTVWQSPFDRGSLETLIEACQSRIAKL